MRHIAILTNYPLFDNADWKVILVKSLKEQGFNISIIYGKSSLLDQVRAVFKKLKTNKVAVSAAKNRTGSKFMSNIRTFKRMNVPVYQLDNLNSQEATKLVSSLSIDVCICALDQILKSCHVSEFPKLLNVHYGHLPYIKGASAAEWSLVEESSLSISLHEIDEGIDTGEILSVTSVDISEISSLSELRNQIQEYIPTIFLNYLTAGSSYKNQIVGSDEGKLYTFMHPELLEIVNKRLKQ